MSDEHIVCADQSAILLGGVYNDSALADVRALQDMPELAGAAWVAVDGGARLALAAGVRPDAVIGDFDSLRAEDRAQMDPQTLHQIDEQETTDFDKALRNTSAPVILAAGFHGARIDHHLATLSVLTRHPDRHCILIGPEDVTCLCPPQIDLSLTPGDWLSLFPMAPVTGRSMGVQWPIDGLDFAPDGRVGTSNRVTDGQVGLQMDAPAMLLILPRRALRPLLTALSHSAARWPALSG
ncbi:thiamine diphosphokinase [Pseudooceanicola sp. MF1-13]|uniref:thiamine diphosphokinase n=1 Tax=Pseudooceanicola sp. MF1-13 TaxID=3379095 RepID=UPI003892C716